MAPSWSTRLFSGSSNSDRNAATTSKRDASRDKTNTPSLAQSSRDIPVLASPTPPRPRTAGGSPMHGHTRSISQPVPRFFSRKKSAGNLGRSYHEGDIPVDDALVPVLDDSPVDAMPSRTRSGKKNSASQDEQVTRQCMCCDSKVKVPKELEKFRCMCCLTINDLRPMSASREAASRVDNGKGKENEKKLPMGVRPPLSLDRTRAIIEQCLFVYLEARSRGADGVEELFDESPHNLSSAHSGSSSMNSAGLNNRKPWLDNPIVSTPPHTPLDSPPALSGRPNGLPKSPVSNSANAISFMRPSLPHMSSSEQRRPHRPPQKVPNQPSRKPPPPPMQLKQKSSAQNLRPSTSASTAGELSPRVPPSPRPTTAELNARRRYERCKTIFRPLEDYILHAVGDHSILNSSFSTVRPAPAGRARSESHIATPPPELSGGVPSMSGGLDELDAKTLLLGDIGENGSWWTGKIGRHDHDRHRKQLGSDARKPVTSRSPNINWAQLAAWYALINTAGIDWQRQLLALKESSLRPLQNVESPADSVDIDGELKEAREHTIRALLKVTENLLKRPGKVLKEPADFRFLLIILANPALYPASVSWPRGLHNQNPVLTAVGSLDKTNLLKEPTSPSKAVVKEAGQHSGILKRAFGLLGNSPESCHRHVIGWLSGLDEEHFTSLVDLCSSFINHRLTRQCSQPRASNQFVDGGLIPDFSGGARSTSAQLHSAMGLGGSSGKRADENDNETDWANDWQLRGAAKLMSLLFAANNIWQGKRKEDNIPRVDSGISNRTNIRPQDKARRSGQLLHTSTFYNSLLDYHDMIADFKVWESRKSEKFAFCKYPFFLSMGVKIKILEYDAKRQMEIKARDAYFDAIIRQRAIDSHLHLKVRRDCMVDDSLRQISEAVGSGPEELKKGLRVQFAGEEGVDAGGLRKEWFLMLAREVFDAEHGLFVYDEQSRTCYFNPHTFETSDQYYLVGALLGLAIYNSTILDIALPPFAFRKLLAAAPAGHNAAISNIATLTGVKGQMSYTLPDLAEYKPALAAGLQQLLDFDGDVESTYCWSFVAPAERYGLTTEVPLIPNGEKMPVTNANRAEFVDAYIRYLLDTAVARQFEPFKRGFFTVCAGNALSLFRAEEIELLIRGSDESLDIDSLRGVAIYENWRQKDEPHKTLASPAVEEEVIGWFWQAFSSATAENKRKLLAFITGSDRIPAVGATSLVLRIVAGGDGWSGNDAHGQSEEGRYPIARTCFNMLVLWRYSSREQLEQKLWGAVENSEGFGLK